MDLSATKSRRLPIRGADEGIVEAAYDQQRLYTLGSDTNVETGANVPLLDREAKPYTAAGEYVQSLTYPHPNDVVANEDDEVVTVCNAEVSLYVKYETVSHLRVETLSGTDADLQEIETPPF